jgi:hypothetical protein
MDRDRSDDLTSRMAIVAHETVAGVWPPCVALESELDCVGLYGAGDLGFWRAGPRRK